MSVGVPFRWKGKKKRRKKRKKKNCRLCTPLRSSVTHAAHCTRDREERRTGRLRGCWRALSPSLSQPPFDSRACLHLSRHSVIWFKKKNDRRLFLPAVSTKRRDSVRGECRHQSRPRLRERICRRSSVPSVEVGYSSGGPSAPSVGTDAEKTVVLSAWGPQTRTQTRAIPPAPQPIIWWMGTRETNGGSRMRNSMTQTTAASMRKM